MTFINRDGQISYLKDKGVFNLFVRGKGRVPLKMVRKEQLYAVFMKYVEKDRVDAKRGHRINKDKQLEFVF